MNFPCICKSNINNISDNKLSFLAPHVKQYSLRQDASGMFVWLIGCTSVQNTCRRGEFKLNLKADAKYYIHLSVVTYKCSYLSTSLPKSSHVISSCNTLIFLALTWTCKSCNFVCFPLTFRLAKKTFFPI